MRGVGGEINRNRMARVGAGRSSEAEKKRYKLEREKTQRQ